MTRLAGLRQALAAAVGSQRVPHLSLANNTFTIIDGDNKKVVSQIDPDGSIYVDVHFVDAAPTQSKIYFKEKFSNKEDEQVAPTCFSEDSIAPSPQAQEKQNDSCALCPHNQWGTSIGESGGKGKACRDFWKTAVVVPTFSQEAVFQLRIPPASLRIFNAYLSTFAEFKQPDGSEFTVGHVITRIYFEQGKQGIINFSAIRQVEQREWNHLVHLLETNKTDNFIGLTGPSVAAPQIAAPKKEQKMLTSQIAASNPEALKQAMQVDIEAEIRARVIAEMEAKAAQQVPVIANTQTPPNKMGFMQSATQANIQAGAGQATSTGGKAALIRGSGMVNVPTPKPELPKPVVKPTVSNSGGVAGIPNTNLPEEIQNMLAGIMGGK